MYVAEVQVVERFGRARLYRAGVGEGDEVAIVFEREGGCDGTDRVVVTLHQVEVEIFLLKLAQDEVAERVVAQVAEKAHAHAEPAQRGRSNENAAGRNGEVC